MMRPRHKYFAQRTEANGRSYASKAEASYAAHLALRQRAGEVLGWCEQVPFRLPGGNKYVLDFLVFEANGECRAVEVKGMATEAWKIKSRLMSEAYPWLPIEVVR